jgi:hypothetical protein
MMKYALFVCALLSLGFFASTGCTSSKDPGVKSNYLMQWVNVEGNTKATTEAAKDVLAEYGLKDITASSTSVDGKVTGKKADGTKITVDVEKITDKTSKAKVSVGTVGDPALGEEICKKIKDRLMGPSTTKP